MCRREGRRGYSSRQHDGDELRQPHHAQQRVQPHEHAEPEKNFFVDARANEGQYLRQGRRLDGDLKANSQAVHDRPEIAAELPESEREQATLEGDSEYERYGIIRAIIPAPPRPNQHDEEDDQRRGQGVPRTKDFQPPAHPRIRAVSQSQPPDCLPARTRPPRTWRAAGPGTGAMPTDGGCRKDT